LKVGGNGENFEGKKKIGKKEWKACRNKKERKKERRNKMK